MRLRNTIKYIYFDLDNTLWDFKRNSAITLKKLYDEKINAFGTCPVTYQLFKEVYRKHNHALWKSYEKGEISAQQLKIVRFDKTLEELGIMDVAKGEELSHYYLEHLAKLPHLMPHAKETLDYLSQNYTLGILSNGFHRAQHKKLHYSGIMEYFDRIITSDQVGFNKPHPNIFKYAIEKSGFQPNEIAYVGDNYLVDIISANKMDITGILLDPEKKIEDKEIIRISDLLELKEYF